VIHEYQIRVRYAETDQMRFVYYGNYAQYFEVGRVEFLRSRGLSYKDLEAEGVMMPVVELNIKYKRPAKYDDLLTIRSQVED
jgi:acyl-CoA thioester hydrolase